MCYATAMNPTTPITLAHILFVAMGGAMGCVARFVAIKQVARLNPTLFPLGTMVVNILGSLLIGYMLAKYGTQNHSRVFLVTGMLGGFTTFSAFSWDAMQLLQRGQMGMAALYVGGSVLLSLGAVMLGFHFGK